MSTIQQIGPYRILNTLGEGGMGVVYAAHDERLERAVAVKLLSQTNDDEARERFWREARVAAKVNHPNICQIYDVGEHEGEPFLAMELLAGEPLDQRIERGAIPLPRALAIVRQVLRGLEALHRADIVHRDLKPSNVFLTDDGVKLLDFGLARPGEVDSDITQTGTILGTPRYMAPEQWAAEPVAPSTDLFAAAAILFEMLTGEPAFSGDSVLALARAIANDNPPALTGDSAVEAVDRVIHRALSKNISGRYASASAMRAALEEPAASDDETLEMPTAIRQVNRLIVLPFRLLRPDEEIDFLSFALADAITASLSGMRSLVVRSAVAGSYDASGSPDLEALATEMEVDVVLYGTLLRSGDQVRLATQLVQVPSGTVLSTNTEQASLDDVFRLQDELAEKVTQSLAVPLGEREARVQRRDVPADGAAYEHYLRANQLAAQSLSRSLLLAARDLYQRCLHIDPEFAPAWAQLGRIERVIAKYGHGEAEEHVRLAEEAFERALEINPDLPLAHNLLTYFQIEQQSAAPAAMERLLERVAQTPDPNLYSGLVVACRFCGLPKASLAAHRQARRLDPNVPTSVSYTYWVLGQFDRAIQADDQEIPFMRMFSLLRTGRDEEARAIWASVAHRRETLLIEAQWAALENRPEEAMALFQRLIDSEFRDPEGLFFAARMLADIGATELALDTLERVVDGGFHALHLVGDDPSFASLVDDDRYQALLERSAAGSKSAQARFVAAGGPRLLGMTVSHEGRAEG